MNHVSFVGVQQPESKQLPRRMFGCGQYEESIVVACLIFTVLNSWLDEFAKRINRVNIPDALRNFPMIRSISSSVRVSSYAVGVTEQGDGIRKHIE